MWEFQLGEYRMKKVLILANNDVGLYKFRKELIQELVKNIKFTFRYLMVNLYSS